MRILLINYEYPPIGAGASNATFNIAKSLLKLGNEVTVLTSSFKDLKGWKNEDGINVYRVKSLRKKAGQSNIFEMSSFVFSASSVVNKIIKKKSIDSIIVFFTIPCGPVALIAKKISKINYIVSLRGGDVPGSNVDLNKQHKILSPLRRSILKNSIHIIANSVGLKNLSEKADKYPVKVVPNGIDTDFFKPNEKQKISFKNLLFIGRFHSEKNVMFLIQNVHKFIQTGKMLRLDLVGEGPQKEMLIDYVNKNNLNETVYFHSWKNKIELKEFYQNADCVINCSFNEGMSNVILEAMASGLPVLASNITGNDELVINDKTGYLFDLNKYEEFLAALDELYNNPKKAKELGQNARIIAVNNYSWEKVAKEYLNLLK